MNSSDDVTCTQCGRLYSRIFDKKCYCRAQKCMLCNSDSWYHLCETCRMVTIWDQLKLCINNLEIDETIRRQRILNIIGHDSHSSVDAYLNGIFRLNILKKVRPGLYRKKKDIPKKLTVSLLRELAYGGWKTWFIPIELIEELKE